MNELDAMQMHPAGFGILAIIGRGYHETTTAPAAIVAQVLKEAGPDWRPCDVAGFAEARARRNVTPPARTKNLAPVKQPDLFSR